MKKLKKGEYLYLITDSEQEDSLFKNVFEDQSANHSVEVNYTSSPLVLPTIPGYTFLSTLGTEKGPMDSWRSQDLRLYSKLRSMPQHFLLVSSVCLTRESLCATDLWSVYIKTHSKKCDCEYCQKGLTEILREVEG